MSVKNKVITVKAEKIVFGAKTLCRCEDGLALFCEGLLPDETAEVLVTKDKKSFREGLLENILSASPKRIQPKCDLFGSCGGCSFEYTNYENQLFFKQTYLQELLSQLNIEVLPIKESPAIWNYRNKMEFSFFNNCGKTDLGLHQKESFNKYVSVKKCLICEEVFGDILEAVRNFAQENNLSAYDNKTHIGFLRHLVLRKAQNNNQVLVNIVTAPDPKAEILMQKLQKILSVYADCIFWTQNGKISDAVKVDKICALTQKEYIIEKLKIAGKEYNFAISPLSFFQTNSRATEILYSAILELLAPTKNDIVLDLFCGTGAIGITIAQKVKQVFGVEINPQAIENAKQNAKLNNISNIAFECADIQKWAKNANINFTSIVVDPPRAGLSGDTIKFLLKSNAEKIIYVSCNPSTLTRDLKDFISIYKIKKIVPVDMFAQTFHVECIALLEKI
ncbi:MAG: 23S rRNA (uracil(1939)-C(5))-methyltransferase RlmD [Elusimicrobiota bacterium]|nr:23S rRNA (uracil(1939)-C(5))-methyltransferase RlmD [Elusimicrobiota bacterium]